MKTLKFLVSALTCWLFIGSTSLLMAQDKKVESTDDSATTSEASAAELMKKISTSIKDAKWDDVKSSMTESAWENFCVGLVNECISIAGIDVDMGIEIPGMDDAIDAIEESLEKHGLDKIEIDQPMIEFSTDGSDEDVELEQPAKEDAEKTKKEILKALDSAENRLQVVEDLWKAKSSSPFAFDNFGGEITKEEDNDGVIHITVKPSMGSQEGAPGMVIQIMAPPVVYDLKTVDGKLLFAGTNQKRTAKEMKNFRPQMGGGATDFDDF